MTNVNDISFNKNICAFEDCNKKIKISDYSCKCGNVYCKFHKYPEIHNCKYDYKENNFKQNKIDSLKCKSIKLERIN